MILRAALDARATEADGWAAARQQGDETAAIIAALDAEREIIAGACCSRCWHVAA